MKIVYTLLENKLHWKKFGPIVVVCLTNHALDQFLEGILKCTKSVVRVGSRSKSETLQPYALVEKRKNFHAGKEIPGRHLMYERKRELEEISNSMESIRLAMKDLTTPNAIVPLSCLTMYCNDEILNKFVSSEELVNWLIGFNAITFFAKDSAGRLLEELICPLERIQEHITELQQQIIDYENSEIHCHPFDPFIEECLQWGKDLKKLKALRSSVKV